VTVYVSSPLHGAQAVAGRAMCAGARGELARSDGRAGLLRVRAVCLDDTGGALRWSLAAVGADARRASQDSTSVGYIGELDPAATRFSRPILSAAGIAQVAGPSGRAAMATLLQAIRESGGSGEVREAVRDRLSRR
jgi:branched-chain amino acid transport system substrate-binding protein